MAHNSWHDERVTPPSKVQDHRHYQFRLVKRFDGAKLVTHGKLAWASTKRGRDKTLDRFEAGLHAVRVALGLLVEVAEGDLPLRIEVGERVAGVEWMDT